MDAWLLITLGTVAAFGAVALATLLVIVSVSDRRTVQRSLRAAHVGDLGYVDLRSQELAAPLTRRVLLPGVSALVRQVQQITPTAVIERLDQELVHAGSPPGWDGARVMATKVTSTVVLTVVTGLVLPFTGIGILRTLVVLPFFGALGYYLPEWILRSRSGRRQEAIRRALPDALDLLSITVEAGLAFDAALERVAREMSGPLGAEFYRVTQEMRLGKVRADALRDLGERTTVDELQSFVLAMIQAEIFGISISRVLAVQADELRTKRRQLAEERAQKLPVKIIFPLVLCVFPALLVVLLGPAAISIYRNLIT
jgi:tight adherence protein C